MKIFITGASGYVGSVVTEKALQAGHDVMGLARSDGSAEKVKKLGAKPLLATLDNTEALVTAAREADAVLHLGFVHEFDRPYEEVTSIDSKAIQAIGSALAGSNKPLVTTSGTGVTQPDNGKETVEESPLAEGHFKVRGLGEKTTTDLSNVGVRAMVIRLAPYVYGRGGSFFVPINMQVAAKNGFAAYVGDGSAMTTAVDVDAAADLYLLAMQKGKAGSVFNCSTENNVPIKQLAEAVAIAVGVKTKSVTIEQANEMYGPFIATFLWLENRASSAKARRELGWAPEVKYGLCDDIVHGSYKTLAQQLTSAAKVIS
jgi:nucleoside-diphosphate-sugar epimerase